MIELLFHSRIPLLQEVDVLVVGAGSAGCCAALGARLRGDNKVMLIERYGFPGGTSTQILDTFYGFYTPGPQPKKVVGGIPDRVVDQLRQHGGILLRPNTYGAGTGVSYNPEHLKYVWDQLLAEAGVRVVLHAFVIDALTAADGRVTGVVIATKRGLFRITARRIIDASGDADVCHWAGIPYEKAGELEPAQTLTTTFRMCNVDLERFNAAGGKAMLKAKMAEAVDRHTHPLPRREGSAHPMVIEGCIATVAVRVADVDGTDFQQMTAAEIEGRRQAFVYEQFFRQCVPGYERAAIVALSHQIGVRETRRVYGEYRLTSDDCLSARQFDDQVLMCGAPIEDHRAPGKPGDSETNWAYISGQGAYGVPYRTLVPRGRDEIWVVGRCFSATHDAHASCRSMAQTMSMGQAAGLAAAWSIEHDCGGRDVNIGELRGELARLGAVVDPPAEISPAAARVWEH